jgi:hypothetical protein
LILTFNIEKLAKMLVLPIFHLRKKGSKMGKKKKKQKVDVKIDVGVEMRRASRIIFEGMPSVRVVPNKKKYDRRKGKKVNPD